ncbi:MAG TPA: surface-adhesin E family protein [Steroidobacteraceae bacterium]
MQLSTGPRARARSSAALLAILLCVLCGRAAATQWQELGTAAEAPADHVYLDTDSIHQEDGYVMASFLTIFDKPRINSHQITMDRYVQKSAFDCKRKVVATVSTVGYLSGNEVGQSSDRGDWKQAFRPIPDALSRAAFERVCSSLAAQAPAPHAPAPAAAKQH